MTLFVVNNSLVFPVTTPIPLAEDKPNILFNCLKHLIMNRRSKSTEWRNKEIYAEYILHLRNGLPSMIAYATLSNTFDLDAIGLLVYKAQRWWMS